MLYYIMQDIVNRAETLYQRITRLDNAVVKLDLMRMYRQAQQMISELSSEGVECRRRHRTSDRYTELDTKIREQMDNMERFLTMGLLGG